MTYENPTALRVGAKGALQGWRVRVAGRVVMGMDDGGETYYWNEFNLVGESGNSGTLVFEETEHGPEWKLFRAFEPLRSMTAQEASAKRVGDTVDLDGTPTRVTLVDESRVYHIEGEAPEGVAVGDVAKYFNADTGRSMLVASWTGDEIEFYEGEDVPPELVAQAFGLTSATQSSGLRLSSAEARTTPDPSAYAKIVVVALILIAAVVSIVWRLQANRPARASRAETRPTAQAAPPLRLASGADAKLGEHRYTIAARAVVETARISGRHGQNEYRLLPEAGTAALLIHAPNGSAKDWLLLHEIKDVPELAILRPQDAAERRKGNALSVSGRAFHIADLFRAQTLMLDGSDAAAVWPAVQYGFTARAGEEWLVARWTETTLTFHRGKPVPETEITAALKAH